jgi:hypothetical protein
MAVQNLRYPFKNIDKSDDYLKIEVLEYIPPGLNTNFKESFAQGSSDTVDYPGVGSKEIKGSVILPIPESISDANMARWDAGDMGPLSGITMGASGDIISGESFFPRVGKAITDVFTAVANASKTSTGQAAFKNYFASKIAENIVGKTDLFRTALARETGAVFNENTELLFSGVSLRPTFQFQFDMVPRSQKESNEVKEIIRLFKTEMAAKKGLASGDASGLFLKSPSVFRLQYMSGGQPHPYLNQFKICALTGMTVNYTGSGTYATYSDATPVHMQMGLMFQELTPIYREDYVDNVTGKFKLTGTGY